MKEEEGHINQSRKCEDVSVSGGRAFLRGRKTLQNQNSSATLKCPRATKMLSTLTSDLRVACRGAELKLWITEYLL